MKGFWKSAMKENLIDHFDLATVFCLTDKTMTEVQKTPFILSGNPKDYVQCAEKTEKLKSIFEEAYRQQS